MASETRETCVVNKTPGFFPWGGDTDVCNGHMCGSVFMEIVDIFKFRIQL